MTILYQQQPVVLSLEDKEFCVGQHCLFIMNNFFNHIDTQALTVICMSAPLCSHIFLQKNQENTCQSLQLFWGLESLLLLLICCEIKHALFHD